MPAAQHALSATSAAPSLRAQGDAERSLAAAARTGGSEDAGQRDPEAAEPAGQAPGGRRREGGGRPAVPSVRAAV